MINQIAWFLKYQPKEIEDYVFNNNQQEEDVKTWIKNETIPGNLLLFGPAGCGKTSLAELLLNKLVKKDANFKSIKSRSVSEIDTLYTWVKRKPGKPDKKKIIYIEEFDRLSIAAMNQLKDTLLEKFQEHVSFIVCTNYVNKIPQPILTRFTYQYELKSLNKEGTLSRIEDILKSEEIKYENEDLLEFINNNYKCGLRDIINNVQVGVAANNTIDFNSLAIDKNDTIESRVIELVQNIFNRTLKSNPVEQKAIYNQPMNSNICKEYGELIEILQFNHNIAWEEVYNGLYEKNIFLPLIQVIEKYINSFEMKKIQHIHFIAFLSEGIETMVKINL
jgi:DNA polymerase III gamma/tau subunit